MPQELKENIKKTAERIKEIEMKFINIDIKNSDPVVSMKRFLSIPMIQNGKFEQELKKVAQEIHSLIESYMLVVMIWAYNAGINYQEAVINVAATLNSEAKCYKEISFTWEKKVERCNEKVISERNKLGVS